MDEKSMLTSSCGTSRYLELSRRPSKRKTKRGSNRQTTPTSTQANNVCGSFKNKTTRTNLSDKQLIADLTFSPEDVERVVQYYNIVVEKGLFVPPHSYPNCYAATPPICPEQPLELNSVTYTNYQSSQSPEGYNSNLSQVAVMDSPGRFPICLHPALFLNPILKVTILFPTWLRALNLQSLRKTCHHTPMSATIFVPLKQRGPTQPAQHHGTKLASHPDR